MEREEIGAEQIARTLRRLAHEIIEKAEDFRALALVGLRTRGAPIAERLADHIKAFEGTRPPVGILDITLYRDDLDQSGARTKLQRTELSFSLEGKEVVLVDDVLYTGRTIRAALAALVNFGRPRRVGLAVLVDRGERELPVRPDYVGRNLDVRLGEEVQVLIKEIDGRDAVVVREISVNSQKAVPRSAGQREE
ncbi:MAG: bifunctional pyr operon transcriptional regulator/uracil phosphoribosyltransferase PyrR [bacterium]|nr:bifunctional pyr operon transcriptional regulator/uracil phosphoribosyltransferase PyrR [bacterium]